MVAWAGLSLSLSLCCLALTCAGVVKSDHDSRSYEMTELPNGLRALLISDPETDKSAAAMDVHTGFFMDPPHIPGLAHFLEHMLFMGTAAYPDEHEYEVFLSEHAGMSNAFTDQEDTNFFFDVDPRFLSGALDRFAQFFVAPLFAPNSTSREMNAVNSEHEKNVNSDNWRVLQLMRSAANPAHPFSKFGTGDIHTLGDGAKAQGYDIHRELLIFHEKHYKAGNMRLVVLGREPLHELRDTVHKTFAHVPRGNAAAAAAAAAASGVSKAAGSVADPSSWESIYPHPPHLYTIAPILDAHKLSILWELPSVVPMYRCKPVSLLADLIGNDGPGSIISSLKKRNWATKHEAGIGVDGNDFALFQWKVALTEEGVHHIADILAIVYSFIADMVEDLVGGGNHGDASKAPGGMKWRWLESKALSDLRFRFREKEDAMSYTSSLAGNMHLYPSEDVLRAETVLLDFDAQQVRETAARFRPNNMQLFLSSPLLKKADSAGGGRPVLPKKEKWYGTSYDDIPLPADLVAHLNTLITHKQTQTPQPTLLPAPQPTPQTLTNAKKEQGAHRPSGVSGYTFGNEWMVQYLETDPASSRHKVGMQLAGSVDGGRTKAEIETETETETEAAVLKSVGPAMREALQFVKHAYKGSDWSGCALFSITGATSVATKDVNVCVVSGSGSVHLSSSPGSANVKSMCTVTADSDTFTGLLEGRKSPLSALMGGTVEVDNLEGVKKFAGAFNTKLSSFTSWKTNRQPLSTEQGGSITLAHEPAARATTSLLQVSEKAAFAKVPVKHSQSGDSMSGLRRPIIGSDGEAFSVGWPPGAIPAVVRPAIPVRHSVRVALAAEAATSRDRPHHGDAASPPALKGVAPHSHAHHIYRAIAAHNPVAAAAYKSHWNDKHAVHWAADLAKDSILDAHPIHGHREHEGEAALSRQPKGVSEELYQGEGDLLKDLQGVASLRDPQARTLAYRSIAAHGIAQSKTRDLPPKTHQSSIVSSSSGSSDGQVPVLLLSHSHYTPPHSVLHAKNAHLASRTARAASAVAASPVGPKPGTQLRQPPVWGVAKMSRAVLESVALEIHQPPPNEYIPSDFTLQSAGHIPGPVHPICIISTRKSKVWHKRDDVFTVPKMDALFKIRNPYGSSHTAQDTVRQDLYAMLVTDALTEITAAATLAGLSYRLSGGSGGLELTVTGYDHKSPLLIRRVVAALRDTAGTFSDARFATLRDDLARQYRNFKQEQPVKHAKYYTGSLSAGENVFSPMELEEATSQLEASNLRAWAQQDIFKRASVESLFHGNVNHSTAVLASLMVERLLDYAALDPTDFPKEHAVRLKRPLGDENTVRLPSLDPDNKNSAVYMYWQLGPSATATNMAAGIDAELAVKGHTGPVAGVAHAGQHNKDLGGKSILAMNVYADLLAAVMQEPAFNQLRTVEQLGYLVFTGAVGSHQTRGLFVAVQSSVKSATYLQARVESFAAHTFAHHLQSMTSEAFRKHVDALAFKKKIKPKRLSEATARIWAEIDSHQYMFDRLEEEAKLLLAGHQADAQASSAVITQAGLAEFYKTVIEQKGRMCVAVFGQGHRGDADMVPNPREVNPPVLLKTASAQQHADKLAFQRLQEGYFSGYPA